MSGVPDCKNARTNKHQRVRQIGISRRGHAPPFHQFRMSDIEMENIGEQSEKWSFPKQFLTCLLLDLAFNPDQDPEEKRAVRQSYRSLAKKIEGRSIRIPTDTLPL